MLKLPEALRQKIVNIWRAGIRDRSVERQRPPSLLLNWSSRTWINANINANTNTRLIDGIFGVDNNYRDRGNYAYGGNPDNVTRIRDVDSTMVHTTMAYRGAGVYRTLPRWPPWHRSYGHTLIKLVRYILPRSSYNYKSDGTPQDASAFDELGRPKYRGIAKGCYVDRMI